jgi:hypothetical protein
MRPALFYASMIAAAVGPALGAGSLVLLAAGPPKLETYTSADGQFRVLLLPDPKVTSDKIATPSGAVPFTTVRSDAGRGLSYGVTFADYPESFQDLDPKTVLDGVRDGLKGPDGKVVADVEIKIGPEAKQLPAREVKIVAGKNAIRVRLLLVGGRLYQVMVTGTEAGVTGKPADEFLGSFEVLK